MCESNESCLKRIVTWVLIAAAVSSGVVRAQGKHRIVVMTDIGGDPDDRQSMVRFLLYACDFDVEGLCTGFGHGHYQKTRPDLIRQAVEAYGKVVANLQKHRSGYPSRERLLSLIKDGYNGDPHKVGPGMDSEASEWIIKVLEKNDDRPVWFSIWGGPRELAQAIWKLSRTRPPKELARLKSKIRVHSIADQDRTAGWVKQNHPDVFWIYSRNLFRGIWKDGDQALVSPGWLEKNVRTGHGPLGAVYPAKAAGKDGVKEGDTPSFFYVLPNGLSDPEHPEWGNWGGRFVASGRGSEYLPAEDMMGEEPDMLYTIHRWRRAYQNEFEARMDWCVRSPGQANHKPVAVCNGDESTKVLEIDTKPGGKVRLSAAGSSDPDGDKLRYRWWVYREAGTYWGDARIDAAQAVNAVVTVPAEASGRTIHVILELIDSGQPELTAYRRAILKVAGQPQDPPPGFVSGRIRRTEPVKKLGGPPAEMGKWSFYRGININGPAIEIDGHKWQGDSAEGFECDNRPINSPDITLWPPTDENRAKMIHSFRWDRQASIKLTGLARGEYAVYLYVWEDNNPERFTIFLNNKAVARDYYSGHDGDWRRLGPWLVSVTNGEIRIASRGGAANFSGIELWKRTAR